MQGCLPYANVIQLRKSRRPFNKEFVSSFVFFSEGRVIVTPSFPFMNVSNVFFKANIPTTQSLVKNCDISAKRASLSPSLMKL